MNAALRATKRDLPEVVEYSRGDMAHEALKRDEVLTLLRTHRQTLAERFGVASVRLFGSVARDSATPASDVDILVGFDGPATMRRIADTEEYLKKLLGRPVDLVTHRELKKELRPYIEAEAIDVSEENPVMPGPEPPPREWRFRIENMIEFCEKVLEFTAGMEEADFFSNSVVNDAALHNIALIGEAARHIPEDIRTEYAEIPWVSMISTRNRIIHDYLGIDDERVWEIVRTDIPALLPQLRELLEGVGRDGGCD